MVEQIVTYWHCGVAYQVQRSETGFLHRLMQEEGWHPDLPPGMKSMHITRLFDDVLRQNLRGVPSPPKGSTKYRTTCRVMHKRSKAES
jgi:hypothetical protein